MTDNINQRLQNLITVAQNVTKDDASDLTSQVSKLINGYQQGGAGGSVSVAHIITNKAASNAGSPNASLILYE